LNFHDIFSKNTQISIFTKIRQVGAEFFHADGQTDKTNLIVAFCNSGNAAKNAKNQPQRVTRRVILLHMSFLVMHWKARSVCACQT